MTLGWFIGCLVTFIPCRMLDNKIAYIVAVDVKNYNNLFKTISSSCVYNKNRMKLERELI